MKIAVRGLDKSSWTRLNQPLSRLSDTLPCGASSRAGSDVISSKGSPYGVIYAVDEGVIYIAAVMHLKRKPGYWVSRGKT